ncbi:hypothetical protein [Bacteroides fluxus]
MVQKKQLSTADTTTIKDNITALRNSRRQASEKRSIAEAENSSCS